MKLDPDLHKVATALYCSLNTPLSLSTLIMLREGEWEQLATKQVDPRNYVEGPWGAERFFRDSQAANFLRKSPLLPGSRPKARKAKAIDTFHECETMCATTNEFLKTLQTRRYLASRPAIEERLVSILDRASKICKRILGPLPDDFNGRFGPGTSVELRGSVHATFADKMYITPTTTPLARALFEHDFWRTSWSSKRVELGLPLPGTSRGNRFTTVPKDATKDRGICIEPLGNLWVQLGIGDELKWRLSRVGLHVGRNTPKIDPFNLIKRTSPVDGQVHHQRMAREGSLDGRWSTIDLSNASDTVALELVRWLLPPDWFDLLYAIRSPYTYLQGKWVRLEKFSSMGNGTTFELESLVFAALVAAVSDLKVGKDVYAYGDDLLVPEAHGRDAMAVLRACGFEPNARKSYIEGPFRESCGGDFFSGRPVRSVYADSDFKEPTDWIVLHNQLKSRGFRGPMLHRCVQAIPLRLRLFGPAWLGDRVLHGPYRPKQNRRGYMVLPTVQPLTRKVPLSRWGFEFAMPLANLGALRNGSSKNAPMLTPRGAPNGYRIRMASVS